MGFFQRLFGRAEAGAVPGLDALITDMHSHVIPGIDDGAGTMEDSLAMLRAFEHLGYRKVITTPHIMTDGFPNTPEQILGGLERVREAAKAANIQLKLEAAAEYYLDETFLPRIEQGLLTFGGYKRYVLFETSYMSKPLSLNEAIFQMNAHKYTPVMAHPERYQYFWEGDAVGAVEALKERGVKMQVNITSFAGRYSKKAATIARDLARAGLIDFLGTDMHRARQGETVAQALRDIRELRELLRSGSLLNTEL